MDEAAVREQRDAPYAMAVAVAVATGAVAVICALSLGLPLRDPDGFLGPTYVRLPVIALLMLACDVVPRGVAQARSLRASPREILRVAQERWPWRRLRPALI